MANSPDEEDDINYARDILRQSKGPLTSSLLSSVPATPEVLLTPNAVEKAPTVRPKTSSPVTSVSVKEALSLHQNSTLHHHNAILPDTNELSVINVSTLAGPAKYHRPDAERRNVSNPVIGSSLVLKSSGGIASMLGRKRKREEPSIKLVAGN